MEDETPIDYEALWEQLAQQYHGDREYSIHGPAHWRRVERNGLLLATRTGADETVVRLFALFHDSRRIYDGTDDGHGLRGAQYAEEIRGKAFQLDDLRFALLWEACEGHTDRHHSDDPTIGSCWDADRLDLGRAGMIPNPDYMSTAFGREIAHAGSIWQFLQPRP